MNAAASSLIEAIKAVSPGTDWDFIPSGATSWFKYGSGGVNSWGSLCGVPNGCIAVLNLMNWHSSFADQIMFYASQAEFPIRGLHDLWVADGGTGWAREPMPDEDVLAYTVANSPLCHASVSKWAYAAGVNMTAPGTTTGTAHKTDRCAKVAAGVAAFTAGLINGATSSLTMPDITADCYSCHYTGSPYAPAQQGKMDCGACHTDFRPHTNVDKYLVIEDVWTEDGGGNPTNTFAGGDTIVCKVKFSVVGPGTCFVKTVTSRAKGPCGKIMGLPMNQTVMSGTNVWSWSGTVPSSCSGTAKVIMNLNAFEYQGGNLLAQAKKNYNFEIT
jgi:hypothetical protein